MMMAKRRRDDLHEGGRATIARRTWRLSAWSGIAILAVAAAAVPAYTETGARRLAFGEAATAATGRSGLADFETRRLAEAVRVLTTDRDRLAARVAALERNLDDVTGSIASRPTADRSANPAASPLPPNLVPGAAFSAETARPPPPPVAVVSPPQAASARSAPSAPLAAETGAAASTATKTEFGIDLGTAATVEGLRNLWSAIKGTHAPLLEGLRPIVAVGDGAKPGALELRLVAGPPAKPGRAAGLLGGA